MNEMNYLHTFLFSLRWVNTAYTKNSAILEGSNYE